MKTRKQIKKQLAIAVTAALLALPLGTSLVLADTASSVEATTSTTTSTDTTSADTTSADTTSTDATSTDTTSTDTTSTDTTSTDTTTTDNTSTDTTNTDVDTTPVVDADGNAVDPANWLSDLIGKLKMALAFDPARKGELSEEQALTKLAKAHKLMTEGKTAESEIAFSEYTDKITKAQEFLEKIEDPDSEQAQKLTIALANVNHNNIKVLGNLLEKLPPQAAQKLALNVVRSMEKAVSKMEKQEAKNAAKTAPETTTPATEPQTAPVTPNKVLEKQAKEALKDFKKSLKQKGKIHLENDVDQDDEDQDQDDEDKDDVVASTQQPSVNNTQPTSATVAPAKPQPQTSVRSFEMVKEHSYQQDDESKDRDGDKKQENKRDHR